MEEVVAIENFEPSSSVHSTVPHVIQEHSWDCGLACVQMVLKYLSLDLTNFQEVCKKVGFDDSVWTIDLAAILSLYNVKSVFYTITIGVDKEYSKKIFYKSHFDADEERVNRLFVEAETRGIKLENRSVSLVHILQHLVESVAVVLVDWSVLNCIWCNNTCMPSLHCLAGCLQSYHGHFIVVVGYNTKENKIFFKNPSYREDLCCCLMDNFEMARKSHGTDEDILLVYKDFYGENNEFNKSQKQSSQLEIVDSQ